MKKILILAANPRQDLDLKHEIHILKSVIERSQVDDKFEVKIGFGVSSSEIQRLFLEHQPRIVHFCGHGAGEQGLVFEDDEKSGKFVSNEALSDLFKHFANQVECVLLNACYSNIQATEISHHINYVIGMKQAIRDDAAIVFTRGFYQALAYRESIENASNLGCNAIKLQIDNIDTSSSVTSEAERKFINRKLASQSLPEYLKPQLKTKSPLTIFSNVEVSTFSEDSLDLFDLVQDEISRNRYRKDIKDDFQLGRNNFSRKQSLTRQEYRWRQVLLSKVKENWIKGVLEKSLFKQVLFEQTIANRPDAIQKHPFSQLEELSVESDKSFEFMQASDIFEEMGAGRTLLILGEPGTGKTISLLKLAERLIKRTEQDLSLPIPVIFNLSSWSIKQESIANWLVEELQDKYQASKALGEKWIEQEELILLLDGLDEVKAEYRNDCVRALNQFLDTHGITEMAVCSRVQDYEALSERLKLRSAICIQPLSSEYINWYLEDVGKPLVGLKKLLQKDKELEDFAKTPLIFSVMSITYEGYSFEAISREIKIKEERYKRLFDSYIERMLQRKKLKHKYLIKNIKLWLNIIAKNMVVNSQSLFLIENIKPIDLLHKKNEHFIYKRGVRILTSLYGIILGLIFGGVIFGSFGSILFGILYFGVTNSFFQILIFASLFEPENSVYFNLYRRNIKPYSILKISSEKITKAFDKSIKVSFDLIFITAMLAIAASILVNMIELIFNIIIQEENIIVLIFKFLKNSLLSFLGAFLASIPGLIFVSIAYISPFILIVEAAEEIKETTFSNQGIWRSLINSFIVLLIALFMFSLIGGLISLIFNSFIGGAKLGLLVGGLMGCFLSLVPGIACIQHLMLRLILFIKNDSPWNYSNFLNYSTELLFLQKVGGGYIFTHRMLMEHFAKMKVD